MDRHARSDLHDRYGLHGFGRRLLGQPQNCRLGSGQHHSGHQHLLAHHAPVSMRHPGTSALWPLWVLYDKKWRFWTVLPPATLT